MTFRSISFLFIQFPIDSHTLDERIEKSKYFIFSCLSLSSNGSLHFSQQTSSGFVFRFNRPQLGPTNFREVRLTSKIRRKEISSTRKTFPWLVVSQRNSSERIIDRAIKGQLSGCLEILLGLHGGKIFEGQRFEMARCYVCLLKYHFYFTLLISQVITGLILQFFFHCFI